MIKINNKRTYEHPLFRVSGPPPFQTIGLFTFLRTYARRHNENDPKSTIESWQECIERVVTSCNSQLKVGFTEDELQEVFSLLYNLKCSVAGRFMWQLGTKTVDNLGLPSLQNCAFSVIDDPVRPFTWAMDMLMLGCGVGYRLLPEDIAKLPSVKYALVTRKDTKDADFIVPDSREGWVKLLGKVLKAHFYSGQNFTYSCTLLRSKGAPIKSFGGLASGPEVLCDGLEKISGILNKRVGQKLRSVDALDIMNIIGMIVVSGNVRRSAQLAIGDCKDREFLQAKDWSSGAIPNWRAYSNNSIVCNDMNEIIDNEEFWKGYEGNGEPYGLINLKLSRSCGRLGDFQYPDPNVDGYNPCAEQSLNNFETCVSGDTRIHTRTGCPYIKDVIGRDVEIFNGEEWSIVRPFLAKPEDVFLKITMNDGSELKATTYHEFSVLGKSGNYLKLRADELTVGMYFPEFSLDTSEFSPFSVNKELAFILGMFLNHGHLYEQKPIIELNEDNADLVSYSIKFFNKMEKGYDSGKPFLRCEIDTQEFKLSNDVWESFEDRELGLHEHVMSLDKESITSFMAGFMESSCSIVTDYYYLESKSEKKMRDLQILIRRIGINITQLRKNNISGFWILMIPDFEIQNIPILQNIFVYNKNFIQRPLGIYQQYISKIEYCDKKEPSYCFSEPKRHMGVFGNVLTHQCCLSELYLPNIKTKEELYKCSEYMYRICKHSLALHCADSKETERIVHQNMRMGIGVTGYLQATEEQKSWLPDCYKFLRDFDKKYSISKGFPTSIKLCTVKPSGCSRKDTLVLTNMGLLRLDEIGDVKGSEWQDVRNIQVFTDKSSTENVTKFYVNGLVPTIKIVTDDGVELESSLNHQYRVFTSDKKYVWKKTEELKIGDYMAVRLGDHPEDIETKFPYLELDDNTNGQVMKQPAFLTKDIAWFLGLFYGDGSVHKKGIRISFNRKQPALLQWLHTFFENTFGLRTTLDDDHSLYINSQQFLKWLEFHNCLKDYSHDLSLPKIIRTSSKTNAIAFIDGLWRADGGIHKTSWTICTVSEKFGKELLYLCRSVGYNVSISCAGPGGLGSRDRWIIRNRVFSEDKMRYVSKEYRNRLYNEFWLDPIVSLEDSECETFDIEVENAHHYRVAGGTISHNTLSLLGGCTSGVHPGFSQYYRRRIRIASESPLLNIAKKHGYPVEYVKNFDGTFDHTTQIITFPYKLPIGTILAENCTAIDQLEFVKRVQTDWSDNSVSVTVYYRKNELPQIKEWLRKNYNNSIKTVSFLLHSDHGFQQAPLEAMTKEEYEELASQCKPITDLSNICYTDENLELLKEGECVGGVCPMR
jgi:intein/homing endonuclease